MNWLLDRDTHQTLRFAPLQGETYSQLQQTLSLKFPEATSLPLSTVVLYSEGNVYTHSTAVLMIGETLGGVWKVFGLAGRIIPRFVRDAVYGFISRNRYRWFGKRDACRIPTPEIAARFLP
ncbi:MAG: DCC1-like thiol-disulfide oxidoreductase family protein [Candidatus Kapabacteria bacterium]|nr:DCC1-like thiol-disulfide oxidoreductase family protein [Candidatus Kapabacteria bacterium]